MSQTRTQLEAIAELARYLSELSDDTPLMPQEMLAELVSDLHPSDLADLISEAPDRTVLPLFEAVIDAEKAAAHLPLLDEPVREGLLAQLSVERKAALLGELPHDDAADVLVELPAEQQRQVLAELPAEQAAEVKELTRYPSDSAGGLMNNQFLALRADQSVRQALMEVKTSADWEHLNHVFVVDEQGRLKGRTGLDDLLRAQPADPLEKVMEADPAAARVDESGEEAARLAAHYRVSVLPVVDPADVLVGVVTYDDVMETLHEEASEDMYRLAGTLEADPGRETVLKRLAHRFPLLLVTLLGSYGVSLVIRLFQDGGMSGSLQVLRFVPMIAALAGNAGLQTSTVMIRGFATGDIQPGTSARCCAARSAWGC